MNAIENFKEAWNAARNLKRRALLIARNMMAAAVREYARETGLDRREAYLILIRLAGSGS